jgi:hypothetical protein
MKLIHGSCVPSFQCKILGGKENKMTLVAVLSLPFPIFSIISILPPAAPRWEGGLVKNTS